MTVILVAKGPAWRSQICDVGTSLNVVKLCGFEYHLVEPSNINRSLHLTIGYLLRDEWKNVGSELHN